MARTWETMTFRKKPVPESWEFETMNMQKQPEKKQFTTASSLVVFYKSYIK